MANELDANEDGEGLTAAEQKYFESGGADTEGLLGDQAEKKPEPEAAKEAEAAPEPEAKPEEKAAEAKPETQADADDEEDEGKPADKPDPKYAARRKRERERIAALENELKTTREQFARGDERLRMLQEALQPQPQVQTDDDPEPDPNEDIIAHNAWLRREMGRLREQVTQTQGVVQESTAEQQMRDNYQQDVLAFAREKPDFMGAYNHLLTMRGRMLEAQGYSIPDIRNILRNEEKGLVQRAVQAGKRPAELIYNMSMNMGWQVPQQAPQNGTQNGATTQNGNGAQAAQNGTNGHQNGTKQPSVVEEIERIQRGQDASKSLSGTGGGAPNELTVEALANMSEAEFNSIYAAQKAKIDGLLGKRH